MWFYFRSNFVGGGHGEDMIAGWNESWTQAIRGSSITPFSLERMFLSLFPIPTVGPVSGTQAWESLDGLLLRQSGLNMWLNVVKVSVNFQDSDGWLQKSAPLLTAQDKPYMSVPFAYSTCYLPLWSDLLLSTYYLSVHGGQFQTSPRIPVILNQQQKKT